MGKEQATDSGDIPESRAEIMKAMLERELNKVGWSLRSRSHGFYQLLDNNGEDSGLEFKTDCISVTGLESNNLSIHFYLEYCDFKILKGDTLCIGSKPKEGIFMLLHTFKKVEPLINTD